MQAGELAAVLFACSYYFISFLSSYRLTRYVYHCVLTFCRLARCMQCGKGVACTKEATLNSAHTPTLTSTW